LQQEANELKDHSQTMERIADQSSTDVQTLNNRLQLLGENANHTQAEVHYVQNLFLMAVAKIDHIMYKSNAHNAIIDAKLTMPFKGSDSCDFGQWYMGEGEKRFGHLNEYQLIGQDHETIHDKVLKNIDYIEQNSVYDSENISKILTNFQEAEEASFRLFDNLDSMIRSYHQVANA
jgi:outer membrane murein-binding lipoprotein Lpp